MQDSCEEKKVDIGKLGKGAAAAVAQRSQRGKWWRALSYPCSTSAYASISGQIAVDCRRRARKPWQKRTLPTRQGKKSILGLGCSLFMPEDVYSRSGRVRPCKGLHRLFAALQPTHLLEQSLRFSVFISAKCPSLW